MMAVDAVMQQKSNLWRMNGHVESSKERERGGVVVRSCGLRVKFLLRSAERPLLVCCTG
jgi:hypothetical protein